MAAHKIIDDERIEPDWSLIETDYRVGVKALRQIASEHGITEGAIRKRAKKEDWERDLAAKVRAKADALVRKESVRNQVRKENGVPEKEIVEAEAATQAHIRLSHRTDIAKSRRLVMTLLNELESQTDNMQLFEMLPELLVAGNAIEGEPTKAEKEVQAKRAELFNKVISLGSRSGTMKCLADSLKSLVALEREAYGISHDTGYIEPKQSTDMPPDANEASRAYTRLMNAS